ncbi:MAG TPA: 50S ribosomal protein L35 [Candidatus Saccharimonadales bacterium]|nr:50S ribosomal protein L35 [Candidatus Saccharimonadales bacterium]
MPKLKTHSGTKKRIKLTKTGKVLRRHSAINHFLQKKSASRKRSLARTEEVKGKARKNLKRKLGA